MAINVLREEPITNVDAGQNGFNVVRGLAQFSTTDLTGTIPSQFTNITSIKVTPIGGPDAVYVDMAASVKDGVIALSAGGNLTFTRPGGSPTSNLTFSYEYKGY